MLTTLVAHEFQMQSGGKKHGRFFQSRTGNYRESKEIRVRRVGSGRAGSAWEVQKKEINNGMYLRAGWNYGVRDR